MCLTTLIDLLIHLNRFFTDEFLRNLINRMPLAIKEFFCLLLTTQSLIFFSFSITFSSPQSLLLFPNLLAVLNYGFTTHTLSGKLLYLLDSSIPIHRIGSVLMATRKHCYADQMVMHLENNRTMCGINISHIFSKY